MTETTPLRAEDRGWPAAFLVYALYLLSIPSAGILALVGVIAAYIARGEAVGVPRDHLDKQVSMWWVAFWWAVAIWITGAIGAVLSIVLIGIPILMLAWLASLIILIWFTLKSIFGLLALWRDR